MDTLLYGQRARASATFRDRELKAIVFDVDGTLYRQGTLRRAMLIRLLAAYAGHPANGWKTFSALRAYRHAQEQLRGDTSGDVADAQIRLTCQRTNIDRHSVVACVDRWMQQEPLAFLPKCIQPGLLPFLQACRARGLRLGAISDYPADAKLLALGIADFFDVSLCAQAPEIDVFKPDPRGLRVALERLGAKPLNSLYVGDRMDVDAAAADAAGVSCAILTRPRASHVSSAHVEFASFDHLHGLILGEKCLRGPVS